MSISEYTIRNCVFGFKCNASWDDMRIIELGDEDSDIGGIRFCNTCQKEVYECTDDYQLVEHVRLNRCVTFMNEEFSIPRLTGDIIRL
jgi:hypothetical protein